MFVHNIHAGIQTDLAEAHIDVVFTGSHLDGFDVVVVARRRDIELIRPGREAALRRGAGADELTIDKYLRAGHIARDPQCAGLRRRGGRFGRRRRNRGRRAASCRCCRCRLRRTRRRIRGSRGGRRSGRRVVASWSRGNRRSGIVSGARVEQIPDDAGRKCAEQNEHETDPSHRTILLRRPLDVPPGDDASSSSAGSRGVRRPEGSRRVRSVWIPS